MAFQYWMNEAFGERASELKEKPGWARATQLDLMSNQLYLRMHDSDLFREFPEVPKIPQEFIALVTFRDRIYENFRKQGVYEFEGARLDLKSTLDFHLTPARKMQLIDIRGPSVESVRNILTRVRKGELKPTEDFTAGTEQPAEQDDGTHAAAGAA